MLDITCRKQRKEKPTRTYIGSRR